MDRVSEGFIKPDFILLLKNVLDNYPDNGQILKELIQNAEDAGATEVKFLLDEGSYPSKNLYSPKLERFQGPALYAFNNAEFSDRDWKGVCMSYQSVKRDDPNTIGRFGVGFKSVFHITDLIGILSGYGVNFIDPYESYFSCPRTGDKSACKLWNLKNSEHQLEMLSIWDQFQPFCQELFCSGDLKANLQNGYRNKTLFRFPLRCQLPESSNSLSDKIYSAESVKNLFRSLEFEAKEILLFLSKLQKIEAYVKDSNGSVSLFFSVCKTMDGISIPRGIVDLESDRILFNLVNINIAYSNHEIVEAKFWNLLYDCPISEFRDLKDIESISSKFGVASRVGLAINLSEIKNLSKASISADEWLKSGQLFCFLPLPQGMESATGFAFHIHGSFIVEQNRSAIKMPPSEGNIGLSEDLKWNSYLINCAIPKAMVIFCKMMSGLQFSSAAEKLGITIEDKLNTIYNFMPHPECVRKDWEPTVQEFYNIVFSNNYNMWVTYQTNMRHTFTGINANIYFNLWREENSLDLIIHKILSMTGNQVINVSKNVLIGLRKFSTKFGTREISPDSLSLILKQSSILPLLPNDSLLEILAYLLSDVTNDSLAALNRLQGLGLLPLENGTWTTWTVLQQTPINSPRIYISSINHSIELLPGLEHCFLRENLPQDLKMAINLVACTGRSQLMNMNPDAVFTLLPQVQGLQPSTDTTIRYTKAPFDGVYLSNLWNYIRRNNIDLNFLEARFFHIIPMNSTLTEMVLLSSKLPLLIGNESVDQSVVQCCQGIGIIVLEYFPGYIRDCNGMFGKYVFSFNIQGISECIKRVGEQTATNRLSSINFELRIAFRKFVGAHVVFENLFPDQMEVFHHLPLFNIVDGSGDVSTHFVTAAGANYTGVAGFKSKIRLQTNLIQITDEETKQFATRIGINIYSALEILKIFVLPDIQLSRYSTKEVEQIMITIFQDYTHIWNDQLFLNQNIYNLSFVSTLSGKLMRACDLFDSNDPILASLFLGGDKFPSGEFASKKYKPLLIRLGLKSLTSMTAVDIVAAAELVSKKPDSEKCTAMMTLVEKIAKSIFDNVYNLNHKKQLESYVWVATDSAPPDSYPVGLKFSTGYSAPSQVCSSKYCKLVGSIHPTVDADKWPVLSKLFGWCNVPPVEDITSHLCNTIDYYNNCSSNERNKVVSGIRDIIESIYCEMNLQARKQSLSLECMKRLMEIPCIFIEGTFVFPNKCSRNYERGQECMPWICGLSHLMNVTFECFIKCLHIKDKFDTEDFIGVLKDVKDRKSESPLDDKELKIVLNVARDLASSIRSNKDERYIEMNIYLPDVNCILRQANTLWLKTSTIGISEDELEGKFECHKNISHEDGKVLGVVTKNKLVLNRFTRPFGQSEKLTNRIKKLLLTTPFGIETFKELIQNADDAGATEIQIILDPRQLPCNKVFSEDWKKLQGPALLIYNNKPFTSKDLEGIQSLGEGSKENELTKTGQYGVGFNAVYHLTDAPSILTTVDSERILCIFDPTQKFVCESKETGIQFYNIEQAKLEYPDSFIGYLEEEFSKTGGSLLRLPLRTNNSDLYDAAPGIESIESCILKLKNEFSLQLLFANNLTQIFFKKINAMNKLEDLYSIQSGKLNLKNLQCDDFDGYCASYKNFASSIENGSNILDNDLSGEVFYKLRIKDDVGSVADYVVVQTFGFKNGNNIPQNIVEMHRDGKLTVLSRGGVAHKLPSKDTKADDNISSMKLFCSLPMPVEIKLPVHVNGCFFLDHDNRRSLLNKETAGKRAGWNTYLMENVISQSYLRLLTEAKGLVERRDMSIEDYMKLFPDVPDSDTNAHPESVISKALYTSIGTSSLLPVQKIAETNPLLWTDPIAGYFDTIGDNKILRLVLLKSGLHLFEKKSKLLQSFRMSKVNVKDASPKNILLFYKLKHVSIFKSCVSLDLEIFSELTAVLAILNYCKDCKDFKSLLYDTPLLVTQDGAVTLFHENNKKYITYFLNIVPHAHNQFVHKDVVRVLSLNPSKQEDKIFCSYLTVTDFEKLLKSLFESYKLNNKSNKFIPMSVLIDSLQSYKEKISDEDWHYTWLTNVWKFLESEVSRQTANVHGDEKENVARNSVQVLNSWHLLPVCLQEEAGAFNEYLMPVSDCHAVLSQDYLKKHLVNLHPVLLKMKMPFILSKSDTHQGYEAKLISLLTGMDTCPTSRLLIGVLSALALEEVGLRLSREEQRIILTYLDAHLGEYRDMEVAKTAIRRLPFYLTIDGHLTALRHEYSVFILPYASTIPNVDLKSFITESGSSKRIVLRNEGCSQNFFQFLDCKILTEAEVYLEFILKTLPSMEYEDCMRHLEYIRDKLFRQGIGSDIESQLESMLREVEFIADPRYKSRKRAGDYYDPRVELFQNMNEFCSFPPMPFYDEATKKSDNRWLDFLTRCGLIMNVTECHVMQFASHIQDKLENSNESDLNEFSNTSNSLLQFIANNSKIISDQSWDILKNIKFIVAHEMSSDKNHKTIICLMNAYLYKDRNLIVAVGNILPSYLSTCCTESQLQLLCTKAGIKTEPSEDEVVQNLENLFGKNLNENQRVELAENLYNISIDCFQFLHSLISSDESLKESNVVKLMRTSCIVIKIENDLVFAQPSRVVCKAYVEFHPYLYVLPEEYKAFSSIIHSLGIKDEATVDTYILVLSKIYSIYSGELPASVLQVVSNAIFGLCLTLSTDTDENNFTNNPFYLPGYCISPVSLDTARLYKSSEIIVIDCKIELKRLYQYTRPIFGWNESENLNLERFARKLKFIPAEYRPKLLSRVIQERLIGEGLNHESRETLQKRFRSKQFRHAILRLAVHSNAATNKDIPDDNDDVDADADKNEFLSSLQKDLSCLNDFRIMMCETVETEFYDIFDNESPCKITNSEANVPYFIKDEAVYLSKNVFENLTLDVLNTKLAEVLNRITKNRLSNVLHKIPPILNCQLNMMGKCLDDMDVPQIDLDLDDDEETEDESEDESEYDYFKAYGVTPSVGNSRVNYQPDLISAKVWLEQAEHDLKSADRDLVGEELYYEWSCYKFHQAAEKAIKAILLATTGEGCMGHNLPGLVSEIPNSDGENKWVIERIRAPSSAVDNLTGGHCAMRYPRRGHQNPHNRFKFRSETVDEVKHLSKTIIEASQEFIRRAT